MQNLASLRVNGTGLMAADTAVLGQAKELTSLDLSCNPCLSEGCMQHLHGEPCLHGGLTSILLLLIRANPPFSCVHALRNAWEHNSSACTSWSGYALELA